MTMRNKADAEITAFFNLVVKKSYLDLDRFSELLLKQLDSGNKIEIIVRGSTVTLWQRVVTIKTYLSEESAV